MKELKGIQGAIPISDEELAMTKDALTQRLLGTFGTFAGIDNAITSIWLQGLPKYYYQQYGARIAAVTRDDVLRVAKQYVDLDHLAIVIVGDRKAIESGLKATAIARIAWEEPAAMAPRPDRIRVQPAPQGCAADGGD
jgi:zinc protease